MFFACILAAMIHDVGHDGHNNGFHINSESEFAVLYSDQSPLEHHHLATAFRIINQIGLLAEWPVERKRRVRERIIHMVLGTDFAVNMKIINTFTVMLAAEPPAEATPPPPMARSPTTKLPHGKPNSRSSTTTAPAQLGRFSSFDGHNGAVEGPPPRSRHAAEASGRPVFTSSAASMTEAEQVQLAIMILKVADLSYPSKGLDYSLQCIDRCLDEFFEQGDQEKALGLPVGYDRETLDKPKSQVRTH